MPGRAGIDPHLLGRKARYTAPGRRPCSPPVLPVAELGAGAELEQWAADLEEGARAGKVREREWGLLGRPSPPPAAQGRTPPPPRAGSNAPRRGELQQAAAPSRVGRGGHGRSRAGRAMRRPHRAQGPGRRRKRPRCAHARLLAAKICGGEGGRLERAARSAAAMPRAHRRGRGRGGRRGGEGERRRGAVGWRPRTATGGMGGGRGAEGGDCRRGRRAAARDVRVRGEGGAGEAEGGCAEEGGAVGLMRIVGG
ncbi:hypothetical protein PVAP13_9NG759500 [Panicum virgatum]|uniref:Uncharacterized protein n=1 Tax=Panicum virgatum TaxID=38727 RepID=A0A8T0N1V1_PANVG|nr:hypothetical protein PVAP13_9NG759500 [Panicum virgatum]